MPYVRAFAFWLAVFAGTASALWLYVTVTAWAFGSTTLALGTGCVLLLCVVLAVSTVTEWDH